MDPEKAVISTIPAKGLRAKSMLTSEIAVTHNRMRATDLESSSLIKNKSRPTEEAATSNTESRDDMAAERRTSRKSELNVGPRTCVLASR